LLADQALLIDTYQASKAIIVSLKSSFMFLVCFIPSSGQLTDTDNALALRVIGFVNKVMQHTLNDQTQSADSFAKLRVGFLKVVVTLGRTFSPQAEFCTIIVNLLCDVHVKTTSTRGHVESPVFDALMPLLPDLVDALAAADEFPALVRFTAICKAPEPIALSVRRHVHRQPRGTAGR
jgi:hypothetical protein